jgi:hypothetical protein
MPLPQMEPEQSQQQFSNQENGLEPKVTIQRQME